MYTYIYILYMQLCANVYVCLARYRKDGSHKKSIRTSDNRVTPVKVLRKNTQMIPYFVTDISYAWGALSTRKKKKVIFNKTYFLKIRDWKD